MGAIARAGRVRRGAACAALLLLCTASSGDVSGLTAQGPEPLLDVPFVPQRPELCGGAAAAMVARYWSASDVLAEDFEHLVTDDARGIRAADLRREVRSRGWRALAFRGDAAEVRRHLARGRPVIALLEVGPDRFHYVVVVGWLGGSVVLHDPALGAYRVLTEAELARAWEAAGRWAMLMLPGERAADGGPDRSVGKRDASAPAEAGSAPAASPPPACEPLTREGVQRARAGRHEAAARVLEAAARACPAAAAPLRELAGLRLRQGRAAEAAALGERALARAPGDAHALRTLAAARYLAGDAAGALEAWHRLGEARLDLVRVEGARRISQPILLRHLGLRPGEPLTAGGYATAARRLDAFPALEASRLALRPRGDGSVALVAAVHELPAGPPSGPALAAAGARALVQREVTLRMAGLVRGGERWTLAVRPEAGRPRVLLALEAPTSLPPAGATWRVEGFWEAQTYRIPGAGGSAGADAADAETLREERVRGGLSVGRWETGALGWRLGLALDRWVGAAARPAAAVGLELRPGERWALAAEAEGWAGAGGRGGFAAGALRADWRSAAGRDGLVWEARAGAAGAGAGAPRALWPGAGEGRARPATLRAHPLLEDGAIGGPAFGRGLLHGGLEATAWWAPGAPLRPALPVDLGAAAFLDLASAAARGAGGALGPAPAEGPGPGDGEAGLGPLHGDIGLGLRVALPGRPGALRLDVARGLRDGATALTAGWEIAWPPPPR